MFDKLFALAALLAFAIDGPTRMLGPARPGDAEASPAEG
jgi:hypothetical protein